MQKAKYEIIYDVVSNLNSKCHSLTTVSTRVMVRPVLQKPDILAKSLGLEYSLTPSRPGNTDSRDFESETQRSPLPLSCLSPSFLCGNFPPEFHHNRTRGSTALPRDRELTLRYLPRQHTALHTCAESESASHHPLLLGCSITFAWHSQGAEMGGIPNAKEGHLKIGSLEDL